MATRSLRYLGPAVTAVGALVWSGAAHAADIQAGPSDYRSKVSALQPGDTLHLASGTYSDLLSVSGRHGRADAWITITGPESGAPAVFEADPGPCCNTIEISDSSYVVLRNLVVDGKKVGGAFGINASRAPVHHITVEGCTFSNHDAGQQTVAISTKVTTWNWIIRKNRIVGAGTGLYLGNSDGTQPFIGGLIENNLVADPIGYCMEIKWQRSRTAQAGMPEQPTSTVIRNNVFIKTDRPSESGDRPNLLVGGFPDSGLGSMDRYEIYGNFFFHNPRESLLQASGRVTIHDNVFVDSASAAIRLMDHDLPLRLAHVYNNTIYGTQTGIGFSSTAREGDAVIGNLVFASTPISGPIQMQRDNLIDSVPNAASYVTNPSLALGAMDFYPLLGKCEGPALGLAPFAADTDYDKDFNGASKGALTFRGAYAGSGQNPGWKLANDLKGGGASGMPTGGTGAGGSSGAPGGAGGAAGSGGGGGSNTGGTAGSSSGASAGGNSGSSGSGAVSGNSAAAPRGEADESGCGCRTTGRNGSGWIVALLALALTTAGRSRARSKTKSQTKPTFFATPAAFRRWLDAHHETETELLVGFYKRSSGKPSISWPESVDEALCFGWIDGVRKSLGADAYTIRFTPRKPSSVWSAINVAKVAALKKLGKMRPAGLRAFSKRTAERTGVYSFERNEAAKFAPAHEKALRANRKAAAFFDAQPSWYRRTATHWVISAKREETRERRLQQLMADSAAGRWIGPLTRPEPKSGSK